MTYVYSMQKAPDGMKDYLDRMFERGKYSRSREAVRFRCYVNNTVTNIE